ncbi:hypothetical protein, partial [Aeromonas caviae]|uniref:hypothetical protein n=1 Tax=Aeromonas caviae TaxID=648 RepID=UPI001CC3C664
MITARLGCLYALQPAGLLLLALLALKLLPGPQMVQEAGQELESKERQQEQARRLEGIETAQPRRYH